MNRYIPSLDPLPSEIAYFDGERYLCHETRCFIVSARVEECGRIPRYDGYYVPILRCECCGSLYFGIDTLEDAPKHEPPAPPVKHEPPHQERDIILPNLLTV